jgi:hypothetical protein
MRPNFVTPKTVKKRYICQQNWPICAEGSLFLAKLGDSSLTVDEKGYLLTYVQFIADSHNGQFRTVTFEYDRTKVTRDILAVDIEFGCCADSCIEAVLGWVDVIKAQVEDLAANGGGDGGGDPPADRFVSGMSIEDGAGGSKKLRLTFSTGSPSYREVTLPSEVVGTPNPYPTAASIQAGNVIRITLSDTTFVEVTLPTIPAAISDLTLDGSSLTLTLAAGDPITVDLSDLPGLNGSSGAVPVTNANDTVAEIEGAYSPEQKAAGLIVRWTDADGMPRISIANTGGWTHLMAQAGVMGTAKPFTPSAAQQLTTTYADIDGSSVTYTPKSANSVIVYRYAFQLAGGDTDDPVNASFRLVSNGNVVSGSVANFYGGVTLAVPGSNYVPLQQLAIYEQTLPSWGTTARTVKLQGREYNSSNEAKVHETNGAEGSATPLLVKATLTILEFLPIAA